MDVNGEGPALVLVHGVATSRSIWRHVLPDLATRHMVATPDMPGFGGSPAAGPGFVLEQVADVLADALAGLPTPFDLLGNSLGGAVAIVLAERRPELVRRLILQRPPASRRTAPDPHDRRPGQRRRGRRPAPRRAAAGRQRGRPASAALRTPDRPRGRLGRRGARDHRRLAGSEAGRGGHRRGGGGRPPTVPVAARGAGRVPVGRPGPPVPGPAGCRACVRWSRGRPPRSSRAPGTCPSSTARASTSRPSSGCSPRSPFRDTSVPRSI